MKKEFEPIEVNVIKLEAEDVIATSDKNESPIEN